tara:strand:- start:893 stop:1516 length:624 start_codon:yes stop_codon:yes gene_type:complete
MSEENLDDSPAVDVEALVKENESMKSKLGELLAETKKAKAAAKASDEVAEREAREKAQKAGDYEQLHKSSEVARQSLESQLSALKDGISSEKKSSASLRLAGELAEGHNAELLSEFIGRRLKYTDDGLKVIDGSGDLTIASIDDLKNEFQNDARYASLLRGNRSSGGSASGSKEGGSAAKEMNRTDFDNMPADKQHAFIRSGGKPKD